MPNHQLKQASILTMSTFSFTICFAVWVIFSIIGIPIAENLQLNETQFGVLAATPILTGALSRLPLGLLADKYGGRLVFFFLMLSLIVPIYLISHATEYWQFLLLGLFVGIAGGAFPIGISYTVRWFEQERQGLAMGIFGAGNAGAAITQFLAPPLVIYYGWQSVPQIYAVVVLLTVIAFWFFSYTCPNYKVGPQVSFKDQLAVLKDWRV